LPRFIRRGRKSYNTYDKYDESETPYQKLLRNAFLLGLDTTKIIRKCEIKKELDNIENFKSNIEKDTFLKDFLTDNNKIDINIIDLEENINTLQNKIENFEIAEDYKTIQDEANAIDYELRSLGNKIVVYENAIKNIDKSLETKSDISKERIFNLYNEAQIALPDLIKKNISELETFHTQLLDNRVRRLLGEKSKIEKIIYSLSSKRKELETGLNDKLKYLNKYGALEEYTALSNRLNDLKFQLEKLKQYEEVLEKYKNKVSELKIAFETENLSTNKYLKEAKTIIDKNISTFRSLSRAFYKDKPGGIEVINNEGENQVRFNINAHIQDDSSDGINEVKIFCFDFTLLISKYHHKMDFIFHDSRLLANMDPRQRATLFKVANEQTLDSSLQYIISVNEDALNSIMEEYSEDEYKEIIQKNVILELTDESAESKLLGINVDIDYES
jgi:uncharacterized protein YydD (DUF2326 family)